MNRRQRSSSVDINPTGVIGQRLACIIAKVAEKMQQGSASARGQYRHRNRKQCPDPNPHVAQELPDLRPKGGHSGGGSRLHKDLSLVLAMPGDARRYFEPIAATPRLATARWSVRLCAESAAPGRRSASTNAASPHSRKLPVVLIRRKRSAGMAVMQDLLPFATVYSSRLRYRIDVTQHESGRCYAAAVGIKRNPTL